MQKDIRFHGIVDGRIEYFAIVAGPDAHSRYFYGKRDEDGEECRFFSSGNEFILDAEGVRYKGNGGSFCEYMFGVDQPVSDLAKGDVMNRLAMYGARTDNNTGVIEFSAHTSGSKSFEKIFFDGNAVCNYFFFVDSEKIAGPVKSQQKEIVRLLGKTIKRSAAVGDENDSALISEIFAVLGMNTRFFLFKLINLNYREYGELFKSFYFRNKKISDQDFARLSAIALKHNIDRYQQERIRIDVMYRHRVNKRIVDEYKNILISCNRKGEINKLENARLTRLKTLSVRNKIPGALFYTLDEMLKKDKKMLILEENDYLSETRQILQGIFLSERQIESSVDREDMLKLLLAKKKAAENRDHAFEEILLEASKACDEKIRDGSDISLLDGFSYIITYFDRYDSTSSIINQLAFMEYVRISEEMLRSLLGNKGEFDRLKPRLFETLFIDDILDNKYVGRYGRKKVMTLLEGLLLIEEKRLDLSALLQRLIGINEEERSFQTSLDLVRDRIRNYYSKFSTKADQELLKREVSDELEKRKSLSFVPSDELFHEAILTIKKEAVYIHHFLPAIISGNDTALREDFLENSGLDRFSVEEIEREYFERNGFEMDHLYQIRKGLN